MEAVVAVIVGDSKRGETALLAWGRPYDPLDPTELLETIRRVPPTMGFGECPDSVFATRWAKRAISRTSYEGIIGFASTIASERTWRSQFDAALRDDEEFRKSLYLLGPRIARR